MEKSILKSKTFWFGLLTALAPLLPVFQTWLAGNEALFISAWGVLAVILRFLTKDKVVLIP